MKTLSFILLPLVLLSACRNNTKPNADTSIIVDTSRITASQAGQLNNQYVKGELKTNVAFVSGGNSITYIINDSYCIYLTKLCHYTYDEANHVIAINYAGIMSDAKNDFIYYEIESGADVKNHGYDLGIDVSRLQQENNLNNNISNPCYALVQMDMLSPGEYQVARNNGDRISVYKPVNSVDILNSYSYILDVLKQTADTFNQSFLVTENKVDVLTSRGGDNVDAALNNKVDYNYRTLMLNWEKLSTKRDMVTSYLAKQPINSSESYRPEIFSLLIANMNNMKQLIADNEHFNQILDNEVLPLLQQPN